MSKKIKKTFHFDSLEPRQLMTAGFRPNDAAPAYLMYPMVPPAPTGKPGISLIGGSQTSIGGSAGASVTPGYMNSWGMTKIVYSASGAIGTQSFSMSQGSYSAYSGYTANYANGVQQDQASWFWNADVGEKTITVTVTYNDPAKTTLSGDLKVNVVKPSIIDMTVSGHKYHMGPPRPGTMPAGQDYYGLTNSQPGDNPGVTMTATVASKPSGGEFGFVQIATKFNTTLSNSAWTKTVTTPPGTLLLDRAKGSPSPAMNNLWDGVYGGNVVDYIRARTDTPGYYADISFNVPTSDYPTSLTMDFAFIDYLIWHPSGGAYVVVARAEWTVYASASYTGPTTGPGVNTAYQDPANWVVVSNPDADWTKHGEMMTMIPTWTNNLTDGLPPAVITPK